MKQKVSTNFAAADTPQSEQRPKDGVPGARIAFPESPTPEVRRMIDAHDSNFEEQILACLFTDRHFFDSVQTILCVDPTSTRLLEDFRLDAHTALYLVLKEHYLRDDTAFALLSTDIVRMQLESLASKYRFGDVSILCKQEIPEYVGCFSRIVEVARSPVPSIVQSGFLYWLRKRRFDAAYEQFGIGANAYNHDDFQNVLQKRLEPLRLVSGDDHVLPFGSGLDGGDEEVIRVPTGLRGLDTALGGGLAAGEFTLVIASTGVGKTVFATQLAGHLAMLGQRGLLISTEERQQALEIRMMSNFARIPYVRIKDKFDERLLQPDEIARSRVVRRLLADRLLITEWFGDRTRSVGVDLEAEVRRHQPLQFVILDWIGGAIGETATDPGELRLAYKAAADKLADIALRLNVICVGLAQAHPGQSRNRAKVDSTMLAECKTLGQKATNIIGLSGLLDEESDDRQSEAIYKERQFFFVSKARKGKGGLKPCLRRFDHQQICDVSTR